MGDNLEQWVGELKGFELPAMALTMQRVPQLLDSPNTSNADYQRIISRDPGFTLAIFRSFSEHKFAPKEPPSNLAHAIALLGLGPLEDASRSLPILKETVNGRARAELYDCYSRAGHSAWYAYSLGRYCKDRNPEEMSIAALLHELAEMMLWAHSKEDMQLILDLQKRGRSRDAAALEVLGITLEQLTAALATQWRLPTLATDSLSAFGAFQARPLGVMLCSNLARESAKSWYSEETMELIEIAADYQKRDLDQTLASIHRVTAKAARDLSGLPIPLSAYDLLQMEGPERKTDESKLEEMQARVQRSKKAKAERATNPIKEPISAPVTTKERDSNRSTKQIEQASKPESKPTLPQKKQPNLPSSKKPAVPQKSGQLQRSLQQTFKNLREDIELERILFATIAADNKTVKAKYVVGAEKTSPLRKFEFRLGERNLFSVLMSKPQSFWLNKDNMHKYQPLIPDSLASVLNIDGFFVVSIFAKGKQVGLVYGDKGESEALTPEKFSQFKSITQKLSNQLGNQSS